MRKIGYNFLLILGLMITFGVANTVSANGNDTKRPKNTGILAVKTSPGSYPVVVDGVQVGMSGVGEDALFYLTPGNHRVEVLGPDGKTWAKEINTIKDVKNCVCLKMVEKSITSPCPFNISVSGPDKVTEGDLVTFVAQNTPSSNVTSSNPLKYVWTITPALAKITSGLGTDSITIDTTGLAGQTLFASVETTDGFYDATCRQVKTVSTEITPIPLIPPPVQSDIVFRAFDDIKARVDLFVQELYNVPDSQAYVIVYQGRNQGKTKAVDSVKISKRMLEYMVKVRGVDPRRIVMTSGGMREVSMAEMFIVLPNSKTPVATPR